MEILSGAQYMRFANGQWIMDNGQLKAQGALDLSFSPLTFDF